MFNFSSNGSIRSDVHCVSSYNNNNSNNTRRSIMFTNGVSKPPVNNDADDDDVYTFTDFDTISSTGYCQRERRQSTFINNKTEISSWRQTNDTLYITNGHLNNIIKSERLSPPPLPPPPPHHTFKKEPLFEEDTINSNYVNPAHHKLCEIKKISERKASELSHNSYKSTSSGKPVVSSSKSRRGRGPIVHEALQRIPPLSFGCLPRNTKHKWHAPGLEGLECGPLKYDEDINTQHNSDNDSIDYTYPFVPLNTEDDVSNNSNIIASKRAEIRQRLAKMEFCNSDLQIPKSANRLLLNVKNQLQKHKMNNYRLNESTMNMLYSIRGCQKSTKRKKRRNNESPKTVECSISGCSSTALVCTRFCLSHIMTNPEQLLFVECTAKFSDNTQCRSPVINISNHLPLCDIHTWKRDNYNKLNQGIIKHKRTQHTTLNSNKKLHNENSRQFIRKYTISSGTSQQSSPADVFSSGDEISAKFISRDDNREGNNSSLCDSSEDTGIGGLSDSEFIGSGHSQHIVDPEMVAEVLAMQVEDDLPNLDLQSNGPQQETNIDLTTVFNDFFTTEQNSEYIPTKEETEELERALEAVNQDVKCLEKLSEHSSLLESLLDENVLAESLANLPDVFNKC